MLKKSFILFLALTIWDTPIINADNDKTTDEYLKVVSFKRSGGSRPRIPAYKADIDCYYSGGILYINFEEPEGNAQLRLEDMISSEYAVYAFSTFSEYSINVGDIKNPIKIEITTDENTYIGYLSE